MKNRGQKGNDDYFNTANGSISAEYAMPLPENLNSKIDLIREAFPNLSKEDAAVVLQSCDCNIEKAIFSITQDGAEDILSSWNFQGRRGKNGPSSAKSRRKRNKKNKSRKSKDSTVEGDEEELDDAIKPRGDSFVALANEESSQVPEQQAESVEPESWPSSRKSSVSIQSETVMTQLPLKSADKTQFNDANVEGKTIEASKKRAVIDAMPRSARDLQRSAVAIARFHSVHEDKCEKAEKEIKHHFKIIRESLSMREQLLLDELQAVKIEAAKLLDERQQLAASLKHQCDQIGRLRDNDISELRADIKHFVGDRKIDEEVANTNRFIGNSEEIIKAVESFGHVSPLKALYRPRSSSAKVNTIKPADSPPRTRVQEDLKRDDVSKAATHRLEQRANQANRPLTNDELKERAVTHAKLKEAVEEQVSMAAGKLNHGKPNDMKAGLGGHRVDQQQNHRGSRAENIAQRHVGQGVEQGPDKRIINGEREKEMGDRQPLHSEARSSHQTWENRGGWSQPRHRDRQPGDWRRNSSWKNEDRRGRLGNSGKSNNTIASKEEGKIIEPNNQKTVRNVLHDPIKKLNLPSSNETVKNAENLENRVSSEDSKEKRNAADENVFQKAQKNDERRGSAGNKESASNSWYDQVETSSAKNFDGQEAVKRQVETKRMKEERSSESLNATEEKKRNEKQHEKQTSVRPYTSERNERPASHRRNQDRKSRQSVKNENGTRGRSREQKVPRTKANTKVEGENNHSKASAEKKYVEERPYVHTEKEAAKDYSRKDRGKNRDNSSRGDRQMGSYSRYKNNGQRRKAPYVNGFERTDSANSENRSRIEVNGSGKDSPSDEKKGSTPEADAGTTSYGKSIIGKGDVKRDIESDSKGSDGVNGLSKPSQSTEAARITKVEESKEACREHDRKEELSNSQAGKGFAHDRLPQRNKYRRRNYQEKRSQEESEHRGDVIAKGEDKVKQNETGFNRNRRLNGGEQERRGDDAVSRKDKAQPPKTAPKRIANEESKSFKKGGFVTRHGDDVKAQKHDSSSCNGFDDRMNDSKPVSTKKQHFKHDYDKARRTSYQNGTHEQATGGKVKDMNENYST